MRSVARAGLFFALLASLGVAAVYLTPVRPARQEPIAAKVLKGASAARFDRASAGTPVPHAAGLAGPNGRVRVVNLWASWCAPCRVELPALDRLQGMLGQEALVIAIAEESDPAKPNAILDDLRLTHLTRRTDESAGLMWAVKAEGLPLTLLVDAEGREIARVKGALAWDDAEVAGNVRALFAQRVGTGSPLPR